MVKVALSCGHGGNNSTPGKRSPDNEYEWNFNNKIGLSVEKHLVNNGVSVKRLDDRNGKSDVSLGNRTATANLWKADIYVSIHHNANAGKWRTHGGTETFYYEGSSSSKKLAELIQNAGLKTYGLRNRGIKKGNHLWEIKSSNMPAALFEGAFMDSTTDIKQMRNDVVLENVGREIAKAICQYFGITFKELKIETPKPIVQSKPTTNTSSNVYRLKVNGKQIGAYGNIPNLLEQVEKAIKEGQTNILLERK